jgi:hypothetical protein
MPQAPDFGEMDIGEIANGAIDFSNWLSPGVTIAVAAAASVENFSPAAGGPYVAVVGAPSIGSVPKVMGGSGLPSMRF